MGSNSLDQRYQVGRSSGENRRPLRLLGGYFVSVRNVVRFLVGVTLLMTPCATNTQTAINGSIAGVVKERVRGGM
jgi:hypothetical protein